MAPDARPSLRKDSSELQGRCDMGPCDDLSPSIADAFRNVAALMSDTMDRIGMERKQLLEQVRQLQQENVDLKQNYSGLSSRVQKNELDTDIRIGAGIVMPVKCEDIPAPIADCNQRSKEEDRYVCVHESVPLMRHDGPVHSVAVRAASDGQLIATASWDGSVCLSDPTSGELVKRLGHNGLQGATKMGGLYAVAFAKTQPDILGCTSCDNCVYLWNHRTGEQVWALRGHKDEVNDIDFHPDQAVMCTASDDRTAIIWDFQEGRQLRWLDRHEDKVYGTTFLGSDNEFLVATCSFDRRARVFDMRNEQPVVTLAGHTADIIGIDSNGKNSMLATGSDDGRILIWDTRTWKQRFEFCTRTTVPNNEVKRVALSPCGELLAAACSTDQVLVYAFDQHPATPFATLRGHTDCVFDVAWGQLYGKRMLLSASHDGKCTVWQER